MALLVADARALSAGQYESLVVFGGTAIGDGGGGFYWWNPAATNADDGAAWIRPTAVAVGDPGRWQRVWLVPALLTAFGQDLIDSVDAAAARATLALDTMATQAASNVAITGGTITGVPGLGGIPEATAAQVRSGTAAVAISPAVLYSSHVPVTLTDASTIAVDFNAGRVFEVTLGGNRIMGQPANQTAGAAGEFHIYQDVTAGRTLTWHADFKFAGGAPTIPPSVGGWCVVAYRVRAANDIRCATNADTNKLLTLTETGTTRTNTAADNGNWVRWTGTAAKTFTIANSVATAGDVWSGINAGAAGTLTLVAGSGVTLTGALGFAPLKSYSIRFVSASAADVVGGA